MILLPPLPPAVIRQAASIGAVAAAIATAAVAFSSMDANPSLFFFDKKIRRGGSRLIGGGQDGQGLLSSSSSLSTSGLNTNNDIIKDAFGNKTVLVTGSTGGIGKEIVTQISKLGTSRNLILLGGRSTATLEELGDECRRLSSESTKGEMSKEEREDSNTANGESIMNVWTVPLDMMAAGNTPATTPTSSPSTSKTFSRSCSEFEAAIDKVEQILKQSNCHLDLVVLNAGIGQLDLAIQTRAVETDKIFQINTLAPIRICQLILERKLLASSTDTEEFRAGSIAVTSSIAALTAVPLSSSYAASKAALNSYFYSLRSELDRQQNLMISLICPGPVDTNFFSKTSSSSSSSSKTKSKEIDTKNDCDDVDVVNEEERKIHQSSKSLKMSVSRCAELYISCIVMGMMVKNGSGNGPLPRNADVQEYWIASQPTLFGLYLNHLMPRLSRWIINNYVAPKRIQAWKDGKDLYDPKTWRN